jgi:UDP-N-acetylmuramoyl-L-alanyl-D-glutamate--2,6-diaminopimelate ligase
MNKKLQILELLNNHGFLFKNKELFETLDSLTTNIQFSGPKTGVYYRIVNEAAENLFHERLSEVRPSLLFLNKEPVKKIPFPFVIVPDDAAEGFFESILEILFPLSVLKMKIFGITGTNGKSTCVSLCEQISIQAGFKSGSLGTVGISINGKYEDLGISGTTPSYIDLRRLLFEVNHKIDLLFMEVSSHAISQKRLGKIKLEGAAWTSFSQDHLDFHKTMDEYFKAKLGIVNYLIPGTNLIVPESDIALIDKIKTQIESIHKNCKVEVASDYTKKFKTYPNFFKVHYNKDNLNLSLQLLKKFVEIEKIDLEKIKTPKGRFSIINYNGAFAIVDYAHTPDAILNLISATRKAFPTASILTLFGCGGDRDRSKRPLMASAAQVDSDLIIVTSDNPRSEEPQDIINDILPGLSKENYLVEVDREKAIQIGLGKLSEGDVLIIAGKGHEEYQEIKGKKIFFSDFAVVEKEIKNDSAR